MCGCVCVGVGDDRIKTYMNTEKSGRHDKLSAVSTRAYARVLYAVEMCAVRCPPADDPPKPTAEAFNPHLAADARTRPIARCASCTMKEQRGLA